MTVIQKRSEAVYRVKTKDAQVISKLKEKFCFFADGYKYHPRFKAKVWDGTISCVDAYGNFGSGLLTDIQQALKQLGVEYTFEGFGENHASTLRDDVVQLCKSFNILREGTPIEVYDYQVDAIVDGINNQKVLFHSPTSSGKSLIIYTIIRHLLETTNVKILLVVPTVALVTQMESDFKEYSQNNDFSVDENLHKITAGQDKNTSKRIVVSTYQSISKENSEYFSQYGALMLDEAHKASSKSIQSIANNCHNTAWRLGFTGSLKETKCNEMVIRAITGYIHKTTTTRELIDSGRAAAVTIKCIVLRHDPQLVQGLVQTSGKTKKFEYGSEIDYIITNRSRNNLICGMANALNGCTLILTRFKEKQSDYIFERLSKISKKPVYLVTGDNTSEEKEAVRKIANNEDCIIVSNYQTLSTGQSIPNLQNLIFAHPMKSGNTIIQSIGRLLRLKDGKHMTVLYDIADDMSVKIGKKQVINFGMDHFGKRVTLYAEEQHNFTTKLIDLPVLQ